MDRALELELTRGLLELTAEGRVELTDTVHEEPVENFTSPAVLAREREVLFGEYPLLAALSRELPNPGDWKTFDPVGIPIVLVRGDDGAVRGFLNVCGHRGAGLVEGMCGSSRKLVCPFHGWAYNLDGTLASIPGAAAFAGVDRTERRLSPVPVHEHAGGVWVIPRGQAEELDVEAYLGVLGPELATWDMGSWSFIERRQHHIRANWKLAMDTFTEGYHIPYLHRDTLATLVAPTPTLCTPMGRHHRQVLPMRTLAEIADRAPETWQAFEEWRFAITYFIFPNTVFMISGDHAEMFQVFPGDTPDTSDTLHSLFVFQPEVSDEDRTHYSTMFDFFYDIIANEDYRICESIERGLRTSANKTLVMGRSEPLTQEIHRAYQQALS